MRDLCADFGAESARLQTARQRPRTGGSPAAAEPAGIRYFYGGEWFADPRPAGWLARMGFADPARAERLLLTDLGVNCGPS